MRKLILVFLITVLPLVTVRSQFSAKAGLNLAIGELSSSLADISTEPLLGFNAGVYADLKIAGPLYLNTGIVYSQKGVKYESNIIGTSLTSEADMLVEYIEIPINARFRFDIGKPYITVYGGPFVAFGVNGVFKYRNSDNEDAEIDFGSEDGEMNKTDIGMNAGFGVGFSSIELSVNYNMGFDNTWNLDDELLFYRNRVLSFNVAFKF